MGVFSRIIIFPAVRHPGGQALLERIFQEVIQPLDLFVGQQSRLLPFGHLRQETQGIGKVHANAFDVRKGNADLFLAREIHLGNADDMLEILGKFLFGHDKTARTHTAQSYIARELGLARLQNGGLFIKLSLPGRY
jgi:hypothetical protein